MTYTDEQITDLIAEARAKGEYGMHHKLLTDLAAAAAEMQTELRTLRNLAKDYDANFPCDGGCNYDGPEETCSRHGRAPKDLWERVEQGYRAEAERDALRAQIAVIQESVASRGYARMMERAERAEAELDALRTAIQEALDSVWALPSEVHKSLSRAIDTKEKP